MSEDIHVSAIFSPVSTYVCFELVFCHFRPLFFHRTAEDVKVGERNGQRARSKGPAGRSRTRGRCVEGSKPLYMGARSTRWAALAPTYVHVMDCVLTRSYNSVKLLIFSYETFPNHRITGPAARTRRVLEEPKDEVKSKTTLSPSISLSLSLSTWALEDAAACGYTLGD